MRQKKFTENIFVMPAKYTAFYKASFITLFIKEENKAILTAEEKALYDRILYLCEIDQILRWESEALENCKSKNRSKKKWLSFFWDKSEYIEESKILVVDSPLEQWEMQIDLNCALIEMKLATYNSERLLDQSQVVIIRGSKVAINLNQASTSLSVANESLSLVYFDKSSEKTILNISEEEGRPGIEMRYVSYTDLKIPTEIVYVTQEIQAIIDLRCISHLLNFVSVQELNAEYKKQIIDNLKNIQESAMNEISDMFYYDRTYKVNIQFPKVTVRLDAQKGSFQLKMKNFHIISEKNAEKKSHYQVLEAGIDIEIWYQETSIFPLFNLNFIINTLPKKYLKKKWESLESSVDEYYDLEIVGAIAKITGNINPLVIKELKFFEKNLKIEGSRETVLLDKKKIMVNCELISVVVCDFGYVQRKCIAVLSGSRVYFFHKHESLGPFDYIIVEESTIECQDQKICIKHRVKTVNIEFAKDEQYRKWFSLLFEKAGIVKALEDKPKGPEKKVFSYKFMIQSSKINIMTLDNTIEYKLKFNNQKLQIDSNSYVKSVILHIPRIKIKESNNKLIFSCLNSDSSDPILIEYIQPESKSYKGFDLTVQLVLSNPRIFVNNATIKQLLAPQKPPKNSHEMLEKNSTEVMIKSLCNFSINKLEINLEKQSTSQGKFTFDYLSGQVEYQQASATASVLLSKAELSWNENCSKTQIPIFFSKSSEPFKVDITYKDQALGINTVIPSPHIVYVPTVFAKIQKYIDFLQTESKDEESENKEQKSDLRINGSVFVSEITILAKKDSLADNGIEIAIESMEVNTLGDSEVNIQVTTINCITDHNLLEKSSISISIVKNRRLLRIQSFNLSFDEKDFELLYGLMVVPKEKLKSQKSLTNSMQSSSVEAKTNEMTYEIVIDLSMITLNSKFENLKFYFCDLKIEYTSTIAHSLVKMNLTSLTIHFQDNSILEIISELHECPPIVTSISDPQQNNYSIDIQKLKFIYNVSSIEFIMNLLSNLSNLQNTEKTMSTIASINIKEFETTIASGGHNAQIIQQIAIQYKDSPFSISIETTNTSIWRDRCLMKHTDLSLNISESVYTLKFNEINFSLCLADFLYFKTFFSNCLPSKPSGPNPSPEPPTAILTCNILFSTININFLTNQLDPLMKTILECRECSARYQSSLDSTISCVLSINYYNPILQLSESFLEPVPFSLSLSSSPIPRIKLETLEQSSLNINITDFFLKHLMSFLDDTSASPSAFSVHNNTGYTLLIDSTNGLPEEIRDGETKNFQAPSESTQLSCSVQISETFRPSLSRIPLFSQDPQLHQLDRVKDIDILTEARIVNFTKVLKISSPIEIQNDTNLDLEIAFFRKNESVNSKVSRVNSRISVPLECIKCSIALIPLGTPPEMCEHKDITDIKKGLGKITSGKRHFIIEYSNNTLEIRPSLVVFNYLPQAIFMDLHTSLMVSSQLDTGVRNTFYVPTAKSLKTTFNIDGHQPCTSIVLFSKNIPDKLLFQGEEVHLEVGLSWQPEQYTLIFYPLVMLSNLSLLPLEFHVELKNSIPSISRGSDGLRIACSAFEQVKVRIDSQFSSPINIKNKATGFFEVPGSNKNKYELVYNVTKVKIPNQPLFTNVVTFNSKILLTNEMENDLQVAQFGADLGEFIHVQAGKSNYFNWTVTELEQYMIIKPIGVYSDWSGSFKIDMPTTFYLRGNSERVQLFIKIDVKEERDITHVIFYNCKKSDLMIENKSNEIVEYHQETHVGYTGYTTSRRIEPGTYNYFAWNSQVDKKIIVVQICKNMENYSYRVPFDKLSELHTLTYGENREKLYMVVKKQANTLVLTISDIEFNTDKDLILSSLEISLPLITFSLIQQQIYKKKEILLITFEDFVFILNQCKHHIAWEVLIRDLQIDCQIHEFVMCPTILSCDGSNYIGFKGELVISDKWYCLENVSCTLKNLLVRVDSNSIEAVLKFVNLFQGENSEIEKYLSPGQKTSVEEKAYVYLSSLQISSFGVDFNFKFLPNSFTDTFKAYFINSDSIQISLDDTRFLGLYGSLSSMLYTIQNRYYKMIRERIPEIMQQHGMIGFFLSMTGQVTNVIGNKNKGALKPKNQSRLFNESLGSWDFFDNMLEARLQEDTSSMGSLRSRADPPRRRKRDILLGLILNPLSVSIKGLDREKRNEDKSKPGTIVKLPKRTPRVFYGKLGEIRAFSDVDCCAANLFIEKRIKYAEFSYYGQAISKDYNDDTLMFVFFSSKIALINLNMRKVLWKIEPLFLESLQTLENSVKLTGTTKKHRYKYEILLQDAKAVRRIEELVAWVRKDAQT